MTTPTVTAAQVAVHELLDQAAEALPVYADPLEQAESDITCADGSVHDIRGRWETDATMNTLSARQDVQYLLKVIDALVEKAEQ